MELNEIRNYIVEMEIASEEEMEVAEYFNGYNEDAMNSILYMKSGYRDIEQYLEYEDRETYLEYFNKEEEED